MDFDSRNEITFNEQNSVSGSDDILETEFADNNFSPEDLRYLENEERFFGPKTISRIIDDNYSEDEYINFLYQQLLRKNMYADDKGTLQFGEMSSSEYIMLGLENFLHDQINNINFFNINDYKKNFNNPLFETLYKLKYLCRNRNFTIANSFYSYHLDEVYNGLISNNSERVTNKLLNLFFDFSQFQQNLETNYVKVNRYDKCYALLKNKRMYVDLIKNGIQDILMEPISIDERIRRLFVLFSTTFLNIMNESIKKIDSFRKINVNVEKEFYVYRVISLKENSLDSFVKENTCGFISTTYDIRSLFNYANGSVLTCTSSARLGDCNKILFMLIKILPGTKVATTNCCGFSEEEIIIVSPGKFDIKKQFDINNKQIPISMIVADYIPEKDPGYKCPTNINVYDFFRQNKKTIYDKFVQKVVR